MKIGIICPICYKPKRYSDTYAVRLIDYTEEPKEVVAEGKKAKVVYSEKRVRICRTDARKMGYKIKVPKPKVKK